MPAFTPNLNLYKPGGGSSGTILPDESVDIDRLNANSDIIDTFAGTVNSTLKKFPLAVNSAGDRDAWFPSPNAGDRVFRRDLNQEQTYINSPTFIGWAISDPFYIPRSTGIVGGSQHADGRFVFDGTANPAISGLFREGRSYRITYRGFTNTVALRLRTDAGAVAAANYNYRRIYASGSTVTTDVINTGTGPQQISPWPFSGTDMWAELWLNLPASPIATAFAARAGAWTGTTSNGSGTLEGLHADNTVYGGLQIVGTPNNGAIMRIYEEG